MEDISGPLKRNHASTETLSKAVFQMGTRGVQKIYKAHFLAHTGEKVEEFAGTQPPSLHLL